MIATKFARLSIIANEYTVRSLRVLALTMTEFGAIAFNNLAAVMMASPVGV
jgi:hypothetical protein